MQHRNESVGGAVAQCELAAALEGRLKEWSRFELDRLHSRPCLSMAQLYACVPGDYVKCVQYWGSRSRTMSSPVQTGRNQSQSLPAMLPSQVIAAVFASRGGQSTSAANRQSAPANGRKGGRPRKRKAA